jgi:hypothetical protein
VLEEVYTRTVPLRTELPRAKVISEISIQKLAYHSVSLASAVLFGVVRVAAITSSSVLVWIFRAQNEGNN